MRKRGIYGCNHDFQRPKGIRISVHVMSLFENKMIEVKNQNRDYKLSQKVGGGVKT